jgi:hypothetical protein
MKSTNPDHPVLKSSLYSLTAHSSYPTSTLHPSPLHLPTKPSSKAEASNSSGSSAPTPPHLPLHLPRPIKRLHLQRSNLTIQLIILSIVTNSLRVLYGRLPNTAHSGSRVGSDGRPGGLGAEELDAGSSCCLLPRPRPLLLPRMFCAMSVSWEKTKGCVSVIVLKT